MKITFYKLGIAAVFVLLLYSCNEKKSLKNNDLNPIVYSFIAHAGGEIDRIKYTNSLEALNLSYSKGCKLFELDIIETTDEKFVAFHDWKRFKTHANYPGEIDDSPMSEVEFLSYPVIYEKYTALGMDKINEWFEKHSDAVLVTDKVNKPKAFSEAFRFKDRLIMELFTWRAVEEAIHEGVTPMVSEYLSGTSMETVQKLLDSNIKYFAMSRYSLSGSKEVIKKMKENGIKIYVYHLNRENKDERYVWENEMKYIQGMYADDLSLLEELLEANN